MHMVLIKVDCVKLRVYISGPLAYLGLFYSPGKIPSRMVTWSYICIKFVKLRCSDCKQLRPPCLPFHSDCSRQ